MDKVALIIAISALILSVWSFNNIIRIDKNISLILDIFKIDMIKDSLRKGEDLSPEQKADFERIADEMRRE